MKNTYFEEIYYVITEEDGNELPPIKDEDIVKTAIEKGLHVIEYKRIVSYTGNTVVRMTVSTQLTAVEF